MCLNLLMRVDLDQISYGMMMYVRRRFQWYAFGKFLCMSVLECMNMMNLMKNPRIFVSRKWFDLVARLLHVFWCLCSCIGCMISGVAKWLVASVSLCHITFNETRRFIDRAPSSNSNVVRIRPCAISNHALAFLHFFPSCSCMLAYVFF